MSDDGAGRRQRFGGRAAAARRSTVRFSAYLLARGADRLRLEGHDRGALLGREGEGRAREDREERGGDWKLHFRLLGRGKEGKVCFRLVSERV